MPLLQILAGIGATVGGGIIMNPGYHGSWDRRHGIWHLTTQVFNEGSRRNRIIKMMANGTLMRMMSEVESGTRSSGQS